MRSRSLLTRIQVGDWSAQALCEAHGHVGAASAVGQWKHQIARRANKTRSDAGTAGNDFPVATLNSKSASARPRDRWQSGCRANDLRQLKPWCLQRRSSSSTARYTPHGRPAWCVAASWGCQRGQAVRKNRANGRRTVSARTRRYGISGASEAVVELAFVAAIWRCGGRWLTRARRERSLQRAADEQLRRSCRCLRHRAATAPRESPLTWIALVPSFECCDCKCADVIRSALGGIPRHSQNAPCMWFNYGAAASRKWHLWFGVKVHPRSFWWASATRQSGRELLRHR